MNISGLLQSQLVRASRYFARDPKIRDSKNIPKIEFIAYIYCSTKV